MITDPELFKAFRGDGPHYMTRRTSERSSPVYAIANVARRLITDGRNVPLPDGYDLDVLDRITILTGWLDEPVRVTATQAAEMAEIGRVLFDQFPDSLNFLERQAIDHLIRTVHRGAGLQASRDSETATDHQERP